CEYSEVVPVLRQFIRLYAVKRSNFTTKLDLDDGTPPEDAWRRKLSSHANRLKEFNVTFREAFKMMKLGLRLWSYVREEASHGRHRLTHSRGRAANHQPHKEYPLVGWVGCVYLMLINFTNMLPLFLLPTITPYL
uniref:Uncharacterized protein n=1 Tax=Aegilops tauschii subsp. strangulata TaxID=200361 RepID=A0A453GUS3_AEGTS